MRAAALLARAAALGVTVDLDGDRLAVAGVRAPPADLLVQLRANKDSIVEHLRACWMPAGAGICPGCNRGRWLKAGAVTTVCDECAAIDRAFAAAALAVDPTILAEEAAAMARSEAMP